MIKIMKRGEVSESELFARKVSGADVAGTVAEIIADVRENGDAALRKYNEKFDKCTCESLEVSEEEFAAAMAAVPAEYLRVLERSAGNIREYHLRQVRHDYIVTAEDGSVLGQRVLPMARVGLYVPGGTAAYPSSVLMNCIPAKIAGVGEIVMTTPASGGEVSPAILAAAKVAGVDRVFKVGGAQAVAAMAFGTSSVPRVNKIFGPGNRYVTTAKQLLGLSRVAIDMPAGPSEVMVLGDETARAPFVAADLLSQAEHGPDSQAVLVTTSPALAEAVEREVAVQLRQLGREAVAERALEESRIFVVADTDEMVEMANRYAAEHLIVEMADPETVAARIENAGSIFLGHYSPESVGDYASGTNHTLPTSGWAVAYSGVNLDSFCKKITYQRLTVEGLRALAPTVTAMATAEGLDAHRRAVTIRLTDV